MNPTKRVATALLLALFAAAASAESSNNNNGNHSGNNNNNGDNGNHNGNNKQESYVINVPEPTTLALVGAGVAALGLAVFLRRRKD